MNKSRSYPSGGLAKRTASGSAATLLGDAIRALEHVILIPLFLRAWGSAGYGEWMTLFSLVGYLALSELGMNRYITVRMTQAYSRGEVREFGRIFKSALALHLLLAALGLGLVLFAVFTFPIREWFNLELVDAMTARRTVLILSGYFLTGVVSAPVMGLYFSLGEFVRGQLAANVRGALIIGLVALTLIAGGGFVSVAVWHLILLLALVLFIFRDVTKRHRELDLPGAPVDWPLARSFIAPGLLFMLIIVSQMIQLQGSVLIIGSVLGSAAVAVFVVHRTLVNLAKRAVYAVKPALVPELAAAEARGDYGKLRLIHNLFLKAAVLLTTASVVFLFFTGGEIIVFWTGGRIAFDRGLWIALLVSVPLHAVWNFSSLFQTGTNNYNEFSVIVTVSAAFGLGLAILLARPLGAAGVVIGFLIPEVLINIWWVPVKTARIIRADPRDFLPVLLTGGGLALVLLGIGRLVDMRLNSVTKIIAVAGAVFATAGAFAYFVWLNPRERELVRGWRGRLPAAPEKLNKSADR